MKLCKQTNPIMLYQGFMASIVYLYLVTQLQDSALYSSILFQDESSFANYDLLFVLF